MYWCKKSHLVILKPIIGYFKPIVCWECQVKS